MANKQSLSRVATALVLAGGLAAPTLAGAQTYREDRPTGILRCEAPGERQETAASVGAVLGGLVGSQVAGDDNGLLGAVAGAAVGGAAGSYIGCEQQRREMQARGYPAQPAYPAQRGYARTDATYVATANVNVRSGPSTDYARVGGLRDGEAFQAGERLGDWVGVVQNGQVVGYVHGAYVQPGVY